MNTLYTGMHVWRFTACENPFAIHAKLTEPPIAGYRRVGYLVGCGKCPTCDVERAERKRQKWSLRMRLMIKDRIAAGERVVFATLTFHDERYPDVPTARWYFQKLVKYLRRYGYEFQYVCVHEYGSETGRLHLHAFFFLTSPAHVSKRYRKRTEGMWQARNASLWFWMEREIRDYWTKQTLAYVLDFSTVLSPKSVSYYVPSIWART